MLKQNCRSLFLFVVLFSFGLVYGQTKADFPQDYFRSPVDVKIYLSGTFGEPRTTHYHTGLDIKTQGVEGKNLYAIADGYVSRIKVSPYGYGNALYITHPNGYTSVYAHMSEFNDSITAFLRTKQYELTSFEVDLDSLPKEILPVYKGEIIGLSGNSGGSGGPHLHFEIRDSLERPINPLLFGFDNLVEDKESPDIYNLAFYNQTADRQFTEERLIKPSNLGSGKYELSSTVFVNRDEVGIGVHSVDKFTGVSNKNGVYEILLYFDEVLVYHYQMSRISFDHTKHVYSQCDYWRKRNNNQTIYKCFKEQGNLLTAHPYLLNNGVLTLPDEEQHKVKVEVKDFHGNTATCDFKIQKNATSEFFKASEQSYQKLFTYEKRNTFAANNIEIDIPRESLFDDLYFQFEEKVLTENWSNQFDIHKTSTPLAKYYNLKLRPNYSQIDTNLIDKYVIVRKDYKGRTRALEDTRYVKQFFTAESRDFGTHYLSIDTIAPKISPVNFYQNKTISNQTTLQLKATDNLSGILEYNAFVNGKWVLLEYDAKRALFTYYINEKMVKGDNTFEVIISDERKNAAHLQVELKF